MNDRLLFLISYANLFTLLVAVGVGLFRWRYCSVSLRLAWAGLASYLLLFLVQVLASHLDLPLNYRLSTYAITACFGVAFSLCYALAVPPGRSRWIILSLGALGFTGLLVEAAGLTETLPIAQLATPFQTVINTLIPLIYLRYLTQTARSSLLLMPLFWISIGRLISSLTNTLFDTLNSSLADSSRDLLIWWLCIQLVITAGCNLIYAFGFWKTRRQ